MKLQRFFLAAVATCAFIASYAVPCVCVAQDYGYSEAHGKEICDPLPPSTHIVAFNGRSSPIEKGGKLSGQDFRGAKIHNVKVEEVNFSYCNFTGADFRQTIFVRCNFSNAILSNIQADDLTTYVDCNFDDAVIKDFDARSLTLAQFQGTRSYKEKKLTRVRFSDTPYQHDFSGFTLDYSSAPNSSSHIYFYAAQRDFTNASLKGVFCGLTAEQLKQTKNFQISRYEDLHIINIPRNINAAPLDYRNFDFSRAFLKNCHFDGVDLTDANFTNAALIDCDDIYLTLDQLKTTWNWQVQRLTLIGFPAGKVRPEIAAQLAKEAAQATETEASPETAPETQSETAPASETK